MYLYCNVTGFPHPTITWAKDGVVAPAERTSWLNFTNMNRDKSGNYTCHANNTCGKTSSLPRRIEVLCKNTSFFPKHLITAGINNFCKHQLA